MKLATTSPNTLFTLSGSWHETTWLYEALAFATEGDAVLLMQDAVLALQSPTTLGSFIGKCDAKGIKLYALQEDCDLRGIINQYAAIRMTDYAGFVSLTTIYDKQVGW